MDKDFLDSYITDRLRAKQATGDATNSTSALTAIEVVPDSGAANVTVTTLNNSEGVIAVTSHPDCSLTHFNSKYDRSMLLRNVGIRLQYHKPEDHGPSSRYVCSYDDKQKGAQ
jgi:hypothetical protein